MRSQKDFDSDRNKFPNFLTEWRNVNGDDFTPVSFLNQDEGFPFAIAAAWLFVPDFSEYRGGVFRTEFPRGIGVEDKKIIDNWFEQLKGDVRAVERIANQFTLFDTFVAVDLDPYEDDLLQFAYSIAKSWSSLLKSQFPETNFRVDVWEHDSVGPQITFYRDGSKI